MSILVNVSYNQLNKKVTISKSKTVGDLLQASLDKFDLTNQSGQLIHPQTQKVLDVTSVIKYSNIINNGKLMLQIIEAPHKLVNLKVMKPDGSSQVIKVDNSVKIADLVTQLSLEMENLLMNLMNRVVEVGEYKELELKGLIGNLGNLVIRFSVKREQKEPHHIKRPKEVKEPTKSLKEEPKKEEVRAPKEELEQKKPEVTEMAQEKPKAEPEPEPEPEQEQDPESEQEPELAPEMKTEQSEPHIKQDIVQKAVTEPTSNKDVLYKPSRTQIYENPEEDYELTLNQAKLYQNIIKYNPRKKPNTKPKEPEVYRLRVKFPNNYILDIRLAPDEKFGELIKRIDSHLTEPFKSNYQLKLSYPPFKPLSIGFVNNNKKLTDMDDVDDKTLFIWTSEQAGQYLIDEISKDYNEMPGVKLELMRDELPDEEKTNSYTNSKSQSSLKDPKKKSDKKVPKWLKLGK